MNLTINRKGYFSSSHKLYNPNWNKEKNLKIFENCSNLHGHNYMYIVSIKGKLDKKTGFVFNLKKLKYILKKEIEEKFDHKNINDIKDFSLNPTMENISIFIWNKIKKKIPNNIYLKITLYETKNNFVEYDGK